MTKGIYTNAAVRSRVTSRLRRRRQALGWSAAELSERTGVPRNVITNFETCRTGLSIESYVALATALGVELDNMLRPEDCPICEGFPPAGFTCRECGQGKVLAVSCTICRDKPPKAMTCQGCGASA